MASAALQSEKLEGRTTGGKYCWSFAKFIAL